MRAVVDTSPLIFLSKLDLLDVLPKPAGTTAGVLKELRAGMPIHNSEVDAIERLVDTGALVVEKAPAGRLAYTSGLDPTEAGVLRLALHRRVSIVIVDDLAAIRAARASGLSPTSTPFLLLDARQRGALTTDAFREKLDALLGHGYFLSPRLYQRLVEFAEDE